MCQHPGRTVKSLETLGPTTTPLKLTSGGRSQESVRLDYSQVIRMYSEDWPNGNHVAMVTSIYTTLAHVRNT